jgi:hypothetical protein
MKPLPKAAVSASIVGALVFGVVFIIGYFQLLAHQPPKAPGQPWPERITSFPPSAAWVTALPCGVVAFIVVFLLTYGFFSFWHRKSGSA